MEWDKGYSARYYVTVLDKGTLKDVDRIEITGGSIKRTLTDLRESADLEVVNYGIAEEKYIRVWLDTKQNGQAGHTPLFTGIATSPGRNIKGTFETNTLECYSMLKIAQDILLPRGWYAPVEANGALLARSLLDVIGVNISIAPTEDVPKLTQAIIAEDGETNLSMADAILDSIQWQLKLDGYGNITLEPIDRNPKVTFSPSLNDIIETSVSITYDWFNCPNVFRAVADDIYAIAKDESEDSIYSIPVRGREVWAEETSCELGENETIAQYASRRLKELQEVATTISYDRRYIPGLIPGDFITLNYPQQNISGKYLITDQSITLGTNAKTSEEVIGA